MALCQVRVGTHLRDPRHIAAVAALTATSNISWRTLQPAGPGEVVAVSRHYAVMLFHTSIGWWLHGRG